MRIIQVGADWCSPCRASKPKAERMAEELGYEFEYFNLGNRGPEFDEKLSELAQRYPETEGKIIGIPQFLLINKDEQLVQRWRGWNSSIKLQIEALGHELSK